MESDSAITIPIIFCTDDNYFPYVATAIQSVMANASIQKQFAIYILCQEISPGYVALLEKQIKSFPNFSVCYIDVSAYFKDYTFPNMGFSVTAYFRLIIPYIFTQYDRVIYLDCDIVCLSDISGLLSASTDNYLLSCVRDCGVISGGKDYTNSLGLKNHLEYFNSGVLVFNTILFREHISREAILKMAASRNWKYADQCLLNVLCEGKVHFISPSWNVMSDHAPGGIPRNWRKTYATAYSAPDILHYVWDKPWKQFLFTERSRHFWFYARKTPFADIIFSRLKEIEPVRLNIPHQMVYADILHKRNFGFRFIMKCMFLWLKRKININQW